MSNTKYMNRVEASGVRQGAQTGNHGGGGGFAPPHRTASLEVRQFDCLPRGGGGVMESSSTKSGTPPSDDCDATDDAILVTWRVMAILKVKLAFATYILEFASKAPRLCEHTYRPVPLTHPHIIITHRNSIKHA